MDYRDGSFLSSRTGQPYCKITLGFKEATCDAHILGTLLHEFQEAEYCRLGAIYDKYGPFPWAGEHALRYLFDHEIFTRATSATANNIAAVWSIVQKEFKAYKKGKK